MNFIFYTFLAYFYLGSQIFLLHTLLVQPAHSHPQPCHILARIGHTVRLGALLPPRQSVRVRAALHRALSGLAESGNNFLPYNLSLDVVAREAPSGDPESLFSLGRLRAFGCRLPGVLTEAVLNWGSSDPVAVIDCQDKGADDRCL
ncbi:hypothetical protein Q8A67_021601 [Cirrhinus molitorella]|uniref:Uncharacterized protein n=1 Tax=Cirrhinus molitorella TaxID=172907 RepID=A0AA88P784_9TELE|nr:hypothetical protein Q8A67_021601 [Cirrhinus molitorella]